MPLPRRILFVTESFGVGGTEKHLLDLLPALKKKGFDVAAFCFTEKGSRADLLTKSGIPVYPAPGFGQTRKRSLLAPARLAGGAVKLLSLLRRLQPSIVHFYLPGPYLVGAPMAVAAKIPVKIMSRRSLSDYQQAWPGAAALERRLHVHMDAVIGNSRAVVDELIAKDEVPQSKVHLIYNGVRLTNADTDTKKARAALGLDQDAFVAIVVANLLPYKGHRDLISALAGVADRLPEPWTLLCVGRDGGCALDVGRAIEETGLSTNVRLLGERSDVPFLLAASDIGLLTPTRNEGFSNAILESMAAGLPMVVTNIGGNAEAVIDGMTGLVVPPRDPRALGSAILKLAEDPEIRRAMGARSRARVEEHFSLRASIDCYCALYDDLLARAASCPRS